MHRRIIVYNDGVVRTVDYRDGGPGNYDAVLNPASSKSELEAYGAAAARQGVSKAALRTECRRKGLNYDQTWSVIQGYSWEKSNMIPRRRGNDGVGSPEEVAYGEGWHSAANSNPYDEPALKASWEKGRAARKQKQKMNTNYRRGESRNKKFDPPRQRNVNDIEPIQNQRFEVTLFEKAEHWTFETVIEAKNEEEALVKIRKEYPPKRYSVRRVYSGKGYDKGMSRDYKSEKGYVAKLVDAGTGAVLARSEPHISNGAGLKAWIQKEAQELIRRGKRVKAEVVIVFFDPNLA
jgi:hypothetical protein